MVQSLEASTDPFNPYDLSPEDIRERGERFRRACTLLANPVYNLDGHAASILLQMVEFDKIPTTEKPAIRPYGVVDQVVDIANWQRYGEAASEEGLIGPARENGEF